MGNFTGGSVDPYKGLIVATTLTSLSLSALLLWERLDKRSQEPRSRSRSPPKREEVAVDSDEPERPSPSPLRHLGRQNSLGNIRTTFKSRGPDAPPIYRIAITGGPCGGKTSALAFVTEKLSERGFKVYCTPEIATMVMLGGGLVNISQQPPEKQLEFQTRFVKFQMYLEDHFIELAHLEGKPSIVLFDRGCMDVAAYTPPEVFQTMMDEQGWNKVKLRDKRYDMVIHMVTCADGAEEFYTLANNKARLEADPSVAIEVDRRTQNAWNGHHHFIILENYKGQSFEQKLNRVIESIGKAIGFPMPIKYFRKYLVELEPGQSVPKIPSEINAERFFVEEVFLKAARDGRPVCIRKRGQNGSFSYSMRTRTVNEKGDRVETKRQLTAQDYLTMFNQRSDQYGLLHKERITFLWEKQSYILDTFLNVPEHFTILRVETDKTDSVLKLPSFLKVVREVTNDPEYLSEVVAKKAGQGNGSPAENGVKK